MIRPATLLALLADALVCVVIGVGAPLLVGTIGWLAASDWTTVPWQDVATAATAIWALGLGGGVGITIAPETFPALQLAEPFAFVVSLAPLAFAGLIAWFGQRAGRRLQDSDFPWLGLGVSTFVFGAAAAASLQFARGGVVRIDGWGAVVTGTLVWVAAALIGMRVWEHLPWSRWFGPRADALGPRLGDIARLAGGYLVGLVGLATLALLVSALTGFGRVIGIMQSLHFDTWGAIAVGLIHLVYLPTLIVWAIAWLLGPGVALGSGSLANPGGTATGPVPAVPMFGLIPDGLSPLWWAVLALPVLAAALLVLALRMRSGRDAEDGWRRLVTPVSAAFAAAVVLAVLAHLSRGAIGPGRLDDFGPSPLWMLLAAFGCLALGGAVGAFLPLTTFVLDFEARGRGTAPAATSGADEAEGGGLGGFETVDLDEVRERVRGEQSARDEPSRADRVRTGHEDAERPATGGPSRPARNDGRGRSDLDRGPKGAPSSRPLQPRDERDRDADADAHADAAPAPGAKRPGPRRTRPGTKPELSDVLRRPDEPDIYADLDDL